MIVFTGETGTMGGDSWRLSARERYANMSSAGWWKKAFQGKSLGEEMPEVGDDLITVGTILDRLIEAGDKHAAIWALCEDLEDATSDVGLKVQDSSCPDHGGRVHPQADKLAHALVNELWMAQGCTPGPGLFRQRVWDCLHEVLSEETNGN